MKNSKFSRAISILLSASIAVSAFSLAAASSTASEVNLALSKVVLDHDAIQASTWAAENLVDGITTSNSTVSGYSSNASYNIDRTDCGAGFTIDLGEATEFNKVILYPRTGATAQGTEKGAANFPRDFKILVSDEADFSDAGVFEAVVDVKDVTTTIDKPVTYEFDRTEGRYIRLACSRVGIPDGGNEGRVKLCEFEVYNVQTQADLDKKAAAAVIAKISALPDEITLKDASAVNEAKAAYDALTADQKKLVTNFGTLTAAVGKIADLNKQSAVKKPRVTKITVKSGKKVVNSKKINVKLKSKSIKLKALVSGKNLTAKQKKVTWKSSKTKIATVNSAGKVKFKKKGTVVIKAVCGKKTAKVTLKIK